MQALEGPSLQSLWEFASAVSYPHGNRFVAGMEELGEPLGFPSCVGHWCNKGRDHLRAGTSSGAWGEGIWTSAPVPDL